MGICMCTPNCFVGICMELSECGGDADSAACMSCTACHGTRQLPCQIPNPENTHHQNAVTMTILYSLLPNQKLINVESIAPIVAPLLTGLF